MGTYLLIGIEGGLYAVEEEPICRTAPSGVIHTLPMAPDHFAGISDLEGRMIGLFDLGACLGHKRPQKPPLAQMLVLSEEGLAKGFGVDELLGKAEAEAADMLAIPRSFKAQGLPGVLRTPGGRLALVVDIKDLYLRAIAPGWVQPAILCPEAASPLEPSGVRGLRLFRAGKEVYALPSGSLEARPLRDIPTLNTPLTPRFVPALALADNRVVALVDPLLKMDIPRTSQPLEMFVFAEADLAVLVDEDLGPVSAPDILALPPVASSALMSLAVMLDGEVTPVLNPGALLPEDVPTDIVSAYNAGSGVPESFGKRSMDIAEFTLLNERCSVPEEEVEDVIECRAVRHLPGVHSIMLGVTEYKGEILPVLDLALCFGARTNITPDTMMILVVNGNFRAFVLARDVSRDITLSPQEQELLPMKLIHRYVYGCHTREGGVCIVLNVETLTTWFDKKLVTEALKSLVKAWSAEGELPKGYTFLHEEAEAHEEEPLQEEPVFEEAGVAEAAAALAAKALEEAEAPEEIEAPYEEEEVPGAVEEEAEATSYEEKVPEEAEEPLPEEEPLHEEPVVEDAGVAAVAAALAAKALEAAEAPEEIEPPVEEEELAPPIEEAPEEGPEPGVEEPPLEEEAEAPSYEEEVSGKSKEPLPEEEPVAPEPVAVSVKTDPPAKTYERGAWPGDTIESKESYVQRGSRRSRPVVYIIAALALIGLMSLFYLLSGIEEQPERLAEIPTAPVSEAPEEPGRAATVAKAPEPEPREPVPPVPPRPKTPGQETPVAKAPGPEAREPALPAPPRPETPVVMYMPEHVEHKTYIVRKGDTLWHISKRFMGDPVKYPEIAERNRIINPDLIYPGQRVLLTTVKTAR